ADARLPATRATDRAAAGAAASPAGARAAGTRRAARPAAAAAGAASVAGPASAPRLVVERRRTTRLGALVGIGLRVRVLAHRLTSPALELAHELVERVAH